MGEAELSAQANTISSQRCAVLPNLTRENALESQVEVLVSEPFFFCQLILLAYLRSIRSCADTMASSAQQNAAVASVASRSHAGTSATESRKVSFQQPSGSAPSRSSSAAHLSSSSSSTSRAAGGASPSSQAYSAYSGVTRRHSLFGTEDRVVLDIGSRYSKFGFSGEPRPRAIVPSVSFSQPSPSYLRLDASSPLLGSYAAGETLWDLDFERCADDQLRRGKRALLLAQLTQLLRNAFTQHLMVDPKQRKVLVVENPMLPNTVKEMISSSAVQQLASAVDIVRPCASAQSSGGRQNHRARPRSRIPGINTHASLLR